MWPFREKSQVEIALKIKVDGFKDRYKAKERWHDLSVLKTLKKALKNGTYDEALDDEIKSFNSEFLFNENLITIDMLLEKAINAPESGLKNPYNREALRIFRWCNFSWRKEVITNYVESYLFNRNDQPLLPPATTDKELFDILFAHESSDREEFQCLANQNYNFNKAMEFLESPEYMVKLFSDDSAKDVAEGHSFKTLLPYLCPADTIEFLSKALDSLQNISDEYYDRYKKSDLPLSKADAIDKIKTEIINSPMNLLSAEALNSTRKWNNISDFIGEIKQQNVKDILLEHYGKDLEVCATKKLNSIRETPLIGTQALPPEPKGFIVVP
ncbi:MAG: hypothetical protein LBM38_05755 [Clostridiales bacterium]|jgi:hypothetical protein|nr:hypothetical protein [Clostridiales bacterium]